MAQQSNWPTHSIRINPEALHLARTGAIADKKSLGTWLEEAIKEKLKEPGSSNVNDLGIELTIPDEEMQPMLERFRQEKRVLTVDSFRYGIDRGLSWANDATYPKVEFYARHGVLRFNNLPYDVRESIIREELGFSESIDEESFADGWSQAMKNIRASVEDSVE